MPRRPNPDHMPARGPGWGGPARGAGNGSKGVHEDANARSKGTPAPEVRERKAMRELTRAEQAERAKDILAEITEAADRPLERITAAVALLDRLEGKPVQRQVGADLGDAGLVINVMTKFRPDVTEGQ